jgi:hypothetical protein
VGLSGLLITNDKGYTASIYYIQPTKEILDSLAVKTTDGITKNRFHVEAGQTIIGTAQDIHNQDIQPSPYPPNVPQHVHVTLTDSQGNPVAPDGKTRINKTPKVEAKK